MSKDQGPWWKADTVGDEDAQDDFKERATKALKEMKRKVGYTKPETDSSRVAQMKPHEGKAGKRSFF